jgi:hypothetical protein
MRGDRMLGLCEAETLAILGVCFYVFFNHRENREGTESAERFREKSPSF